MNRSSYLYWYIHVPELKYDLRSSGVGKFRYSLKLGEVDLSLNYAYGNPETSELIAKRYAVQPENVFISSEGASGQNTRIIRCISQRNNGKDEAIVEYPTYEPLLRKVQECFPRVKRLERKEKEDYRLDIDGLSRKVSEKTALLVLTNLHAPSGVVSSKKELEEIMTIAQEHGFYVLCDEIYAEFDRTAIPTMFSINPDLGITTTSFTKAYGLGGLKLGVALAGKDIVQELYTDVLNTVGNSPNIVQLIASELLSKDCKTLERHKQKWLVLKSLTERFLEEQSLEYLPNKIGITYWVTLSIEDTYKWVTEHAIPKHSLAAVPGAFFLFRHGYNLSKSSKIRLGLGNMDPGKPEIAEAFEVLEKALKYC
ncbi:aminotransferase class I/II-fold pyridoxal phosphate-dependent enzyme [Candidatus Bathyarchaeota archaeon]|nr:aminotransferase class I/II-fold pyridoxal phosphate-dependent enzyme [Candidatus Bathyarchaeota archaeon]